MVGINIYHWSLPKKNWAKQKDDDADFGVSNYIKVEINLDDYFLLLNRLFFLSDVVISIKEMLQRNM